MRENREQVERHRKTKPSDDFYAPVASWFRLDPRRRDDATVDALRAIVEPDETVLDIGAGGGRYALPLALHAREVVAVEPSDGMVEVLEEGMREHGIENVRIVRERWPSASPPEADVALIAHVGYDVEEIGPFLDGMEAAARRRCVAVLLDRAPAARADHFWPAIHGVERVALPGLPEFLTLLLARGRLFEVSLRKVPPAAYDEPDDILRFLRQQLWIEEGSVEEAKVREIVADRLTERDGRFSLNWTPGTVGIVSWAPPGA